MRDGDCTAGALSGCLFARVLDAASASNEPCQVLVRALSPQLETGLASTELFLLILYCLCSKM